MSQASNSGDAVAQLRQELSGDVISEAEGVDGLDVDAVLADVAEKRADYSLATQVRFATAELERQVQAAGDETLSGILMGSRDRYDKNWPRRYSLLRSNGDHLEVSSWDSTLPGPDGPEVDLRPGVMVELGAQFDDEYEEYSAQRVEAMTEVDREDLADKLSSVAVSPGDISRSDEWEIVAVKGTLRYINPQTVFRDGDPDGPGPVMMEDQRAPPKKQPHFEAVLEIEGGTQVRVHFERQNSGSPYLDLPEIDQLLPDALDEGQPDAQASFLQAALEGLEVVAVGNVNSVDQDRDDDGNKRMYVDIAATAMLNVDGGAEAAEEPATEPQPEESDDGDGIDGVVDDIKTAAQLQGVDPEELTKADVADMAPAVADAHPGEVIEHALRVLGGDADATTGTAETDADADPPELLENFRDGGTINCPGEDCLAQEGDAQSMVVHIATEHGVDTDDIGAWIGERV